jgi:hypothetical protein
MGTNDSCVEKDAARYPALNAAWRLFKFGTAHGGSVREDKRKRPAILSEADSLEACPAATLSLGKSPVVAEFAESGINAECGRMITFRIGRCGM